MPIENNFLTKKLQDSNEYLDEILDHSIDEYVGQSGNEKQSHSKSYGPSEIGINVSDEQEQIPDVEHTELL